MKSEEKRTILIVDDEISIQRSLKRSFFKSPYRILTASKADEAFEFLQNHKIDIILSDYKMPGEDGVTFLLKVKEKYPSIIRIIISGYIDKAKLMESLFRFNVVSLFPKPWDNRVLLDRIDQLLRIKDEFTDSLIWNRINNPVFFSFHKDSLPILNLEEYIKYDIPIFAGLLHLYNSDYYNGDHQLDLMRIINHFSEDSISPMIQALVSDSYVNDNLPKMRFCAQKMDEIFPELKEKLEITSKIGDNLSPSLFVLLRYIIFFIENTHESEIEKEALFINLIGKDFSFAKPMKRRSQIIISFNKLWNIATPLSIFSENLNKAVELNNFNVLSEGEKLLFILDYFINKENNISNEKIIDQIEAYYKLKL